MTIELLFYSTVIFKRLTQTRRYAAQASLFIVHESRIREQGFGKPQVKILKIETQYRPLDIFYLSYGL